MDPKVLATIEATSAVGIRDRTIDITATGRRTGRHRRIESRFCRAVDRTNLCSGTPAVRQAGKPTSRPRPSPSPRGRSGTAFWPRSPPT
ncbi:hypothetical protein [Streptomyces durocortorensis]|uniref:Uncharacterized protein n=1 Tax=Streptomyces durocortorensis TaxID=2811104 RepID=A0ABS2HNX9_9ACTN|nr:hypothetical protein [Streptomyces durocortorensis]MBM7052796.1 hypothetical protein [Streptomyces durocortorensis]